MILLLIRHGESMADLLDCHEGRADFELTKKGIIQAKKLAKWLKENYNIDEIYSSPLKRAKTTATIISKVFEKEIKEKEELMEFNNGLLQGLSHEEASKLYPEVVDLPICNSVYEQESRLEFRFRAEYIINKIITENTLTSTIAIISHGGMINQILKSILDLSISSNVYFNTFATGIHCLKIENDKKVLVYLNRYEHLLN